MTSTYDLIVIGTGVAGGKAATVAKRRGLQTAIVDDRPFGGTCPQRGCDPKKVLAGIAEIYDDAKRVLGKGIKGDVELDWKELMAYKNTFTSPVAENTEESFKKQGIDTFHGTASFEDAHTITVNDTILKADKIVIASGASPATLPIEGNQHLVTSDDFFELEHLPERILFIGGGYISFEFAHLCARLGREVIIVHRGKEVLKNFDKEITNKLVEHSKDLGINIHTSTEAQKIEKLDNGKYLIQVKKFDHQHEFNADLVIHGGGRTGNVDSLNLAAAGVECSNKGILVNHNLQSISQTHIYAAGDVADTGMKQLTPAAGEQAERLLHHLIDEKEQSPSSMPIPSVVFTYPKLASVGITQQEAKENNIPYEVQSRTITSFFTYQHTQEEGAYAKLLINPFTDEIIGAHFLTSSADHLINLFTLAIVKKATKQELQQMLWAYPTAESDIPSYF